MWAMFDDIGLDFLQTAQGQVLVTVIFCYVTCSSVLWQRGGFGGLNLPQTKLQVPQIGI